MWPAIQRAVFAQVHEYRSLRSPGTVGSPLRRAVAEGWSAVMLGSWASVFLLPICVPSDYELDVDWPVISPDLPDDADDEEDEEAEFLRIAI